MSRYRKDYYEKYPDTDPNYIIHHIDLNRRHNEMFNLIAIPNELHARYHFSRTCTNSYFDAYAFCPDIEEASHRLEFYESHIHNFITCVKEIAKYVQSKDRIC